MELAVDFARNSKIDIPVCAVIVKDGEILSIKANEREKTNKTASHAEILAINEANEKLKNWRLNDCDMYVTLEPCPMCGWAILSSRIKNLYYGSYDNIYGAFSNGFNFEKISNSKINIKGGIMEEECNKLLEDYFIRMRNENKA